MAQHRLDLVTQDGALAAVRGGVGQVRAAIAVDGHAIVRPGKILGREPEPDGTVLDVALIRATAPGGPVLYRAVPRVRPAGPGQQLDAAQRPPPGIARPIGS